MAKNSFKKEISERYKGRGNSWVRVEFDSKAFTYIEQLYNKVSDSEKSEYIMHTQREGFAWIRYKKAAVENNENLVLFEVRLKGSKIDQPEYTITIPDVHVKNLDLLGNTPLKLQLEEKVKKANSLKAKEKEIKTFSRKEDDLINIAREIKEIKEAALSKPTNKELKDWYDFLKINDIYEESTWQ